MKLYKRIICFIIVLIILLNSNITFAATEYDDYGSYNNKYTGYKLFLSDGQNNQVEYDNQEVFKLVSFMYDYSVEVEGDIQAIKNKIVELYNTKQCSLETIKMLNYTYEVGRKSPEQLMWDGMNKYNDVYLSDKFKAAIEGAMVEINTGTNVNITENVQDISNYITDKLKIIDQLSQEELLELDAKIAQYAYLPGRDTASLLYWTEQIESKLGKNSESSKAYANIHQLESDKGFHNQHGALGDPTISGSHTIDEMINEGNSFIEAGKNNGNKIDANNLKSASDTLYNILLSIGIFLAVAIGMFLGMKFMISSAEDKAKVKEALIPYIAGCVVVFGAFIIWKLAINLLANIG